MQIVSRITSAVLLAATTLSAVSVPAEARLRHHYRHHYFVRAYYPHHYRRHYYRRAYYPRYYRHHYYGRTYYRARYCRYSPGTTGLIVGGVGGAVLGQSLIHHGLLGPALGAVGGALAGRAIDRSITAPRRCY